MTADYAADLRREERAEGTMENYLRALTALLRYLDGTAVTQESINGWKATLTEQGYAPVTVNAMLAAINGFCRFSYLISYLYKRHNSGSLYPQ